MEKSRDVPSHKEALLGRIRAEYLEMPGLCLTCAQAQRLFGLDPTTCTSLLGSLTKDRFLCRRPNGSFGRFFDRGRDSAMAGDFFARARWNPEPDLRLSHSRH
jgi:hypothetical protein